MDTVENLRWATNKNKFEDLFIKDMDTLISMLRGFKSRMLNFPTWERMYEMADAEEETILRIALLAAAPSFNLPYGYFERSYYERQALKQGIIGSFGVIDPVNTNGETSYKTIYLPLLEAREKWAEYKAEGLDTEFQYSEIEVAVFSNFHTSVNIPGTGEWKMRDNVPGVTPKENKYIHTAGYALSKGSVNEYNNCVAITGLSVVVTD